MINCSCSGSGEASGSLVDSVNVALDKLTADIESAHQWVQGGAYDTVPLGKPTPVPTESLRNLARQIRTVFNYWRERMQSLEDPLTLDTGIWNVRRSRILEEKVPLGGVLTLPVHYYPKRNIMFLVVDGLVCTPSLPDNWDEKQRQYSEIGADPEVLSNQVTVHFTIPAGAVVDVWVISSNLFKAMDEIMAAAAEATVQAGLAGERAGEAGIYAQAAGESAGNAAASADQAENIARETAQEEIANLLPADIGAVADNDARLSDARVPLEHAASHAAAGCDPIGGLDASAIASGVIDAARLPAAALTRLVEVEDDAARFALSAEQVQAGDSVQVLTPAPGIMYMVVDESNLDNQAGYREYAAGAAARVPWSGIAGKPAAYPPSSHAAEHAAAGLDPITPDSIGALGKSEIAVAAGKLAEPVQIALSGAVSGAGAFDGSGNLTISTSLDGEGAGSQTLCQTLSTPLQAGDSFTVPAYLKGSGKLQVFFDGMLCPVGTSQAAAMYQELGEDGVSSTTISFFETLPAGSRLVATSLV